MIAVKEEENRKFKIDETEKFTKMEQDQQRLKEQSKALTDRLANKALDKAKKASNDAEKKYKPK